LQCAVQRVDSTARGAMCGAVFKGVRRAHHASWVITLHTEKGGAFVACGTGHSLRCMRATSLGDVMAHASWRHGHGHAHGRDSCAWSKVFEIRVAESLTRSVTFQAGQLRPCSASPLAMHMCASMLRAASMRPRPGTRHYRRNERDITTTQ